MYNCVFRKWDLCLTLLLLHFTCVADHKLSFSLKTPMLCLMLKKSHRYRRSMAHCPYYYHHFTIHLQRVPPLFADYHGTSGTCRSPNTFTMCFKTGNISVCSGCRVKFTECDDLVVRHSEYRMFYSPHTKVPKHSYP